MKKYHVAVEKYPNSSIMGMFGGPLGFSIEYYTASIQDGEAVNAKSLYEAINKDRDEKHKTGDIIAWSLISE